MVNRLAAYLVAAALYFLLGISSASGQPQDAREIRAREDCLTGKVESGVKLLAELFAQTGNANFVYNQARCYEQNGRAEDAINRFREYLRVASGVSAEDRADVDRHIAECRALQSEQQRSLAPSAPPPTAPVPASDVATSAQASTSGSSLRLGGVVVGGVGLAAVATGGLFSLLVRSTKQQVESDAHKQNYDPSLDSRGRSYETWQWVSYGVGAGLVATGAVLFVVGQQRMQAERPSVALVPRIDRGMGTLLLEGRF